ncbi:uncharacterized protein LOC134203485, partial [Armigeres subalbatus]|uniref:uncharacterized protein LOC134203485 n=1 Tax=Armigeres subalbatus TaxID=124917 RepID=UPI002ED0B188
MDPEQFQKFLDYQTKMLTHLFSELSTSQNRAAPLQSLGANVAVPQPSPLLLEGDMEQNFEFFVKSWKDYCKAVGMDRWPGVDNSQKVSFLLSVIGEPARKKYFNFELTTNDQTTVELALKAIKDKVTTKRNIIVDRLDFFSASQSSGETIDEYATRLKILAKTAKLGTLETELVTYKIVTANKCPHLRTKMLTITDIDLTKAVDMCRAEEIAAKRSVELSIAVGSDIKKVIKKKQKDPFCKFCGDHHEFSKGSCPALGKRCHRCKGKNHFEKVCKQGRKQFSRKLSRRVKEIKDKSDSEESSSHNDASSEESESEYEIGKIFDNTDKGGNVLAKLDLKFSNEWKSVKCELDTGANTSLIGYRCLAKLCDKVNPNMHSSKLRLQSFGGNPIEVLGEVKIPCRRKGQKYLLVLQVVDGDHCPLLSAKVSRILGFVKFCKTVSFEPSKSSESSQKLLNVYRVKAQQILECHDEIFVGYGKFPGTVSLEVDQSVTPSIQPPRRVPIAMREKLRKELEALEKEGLIVKEAKHTEWALKRPNLQFIILDEILPELGRAKVFSTVDAKKGFWHVVLDESSSKLTTFWTPFGRYRWTRLPFGIAPASEIFQMRLQEVIEGLKGVECIADDVLIFGVGDNIEEALQDHNRCLEQLLIRLKQHNVKLNRSKLKLCQTSVKFYGHVLTDQGIQPDESKVATIRGFPTPTNRKEVHRFVGMVNYLSRFLKSLSANLANLRNLIAETTPWQWSSVEEEEFNQVKRLVADTGTLRYYNANQPLIIECDASCFELGVVVFQPDGIIGYASRTLTPTERNYAQIEKELLAILFACVRFDQLIVGNQKTIVKTDHKPLVSLFQKPLLSAPRRLQHMLLNLQRYRLRIDFVTGKDNVVADALSRAPLDEKLPGDKFKKLNIFSVLKEVEDLQLSKFLCVSDSRLEEIKEETSKDHSLQLIVSYTQQGWPSTPNQADYRGSSRKFLVTVDHYSDFFEVDELRNLTPETVIDVCRINFARHGKPQRVIIDNASNFAKVKMVKFSQKRDFEMVLSAPYHQQANEKSEAAVKISKRMIKKVEEAGTDFWYALLHWRNIPDKIGSSPASRLFSRSTRSGVPTTAANLVPRIVENVPSAIEKN